MQVEFGRNRIPGIIIQLGGWAGVLAFTGVGRRSSEDFGGVTLQIRGSSHLGVRQRQAVRRTGGIWPGRRASAALKIFPTFPSTAYVFICPP